MFRSKLFTSIVCTLLVIGAICLTYRIRTTHADGTTYYFNNAVNTSPSEPGNYWYDAAGKDNPALGLPDFSIDEVTILSGFTFAGDAVFNGNAVNRGTVIGNADFKDTATNTGTVEGNANFYGDNSENNGTVNGAQIRIYTQAITISRNFVDDGPWTVIADGAVVHFGDVVYDSATAFKRLNGGSFRTIEEDEPYLSYRFYFNNAVNTSPLTEGNYWQDEAHTEPAIGLPDTDKDQLFIAAGATYTGDAIFRNFAENSGTVTGDAIFYNDTPENTGTVQGSRTRIYTESATSSRDFTAGGVWTVIADASNPDISNATYDYRTIFQELNGGSFIASGQTYYFNNAINNDPTNPGNYWFDAGHTIAANRVPNTGIEALAILPGAVYDGNAVFHDSESYNHGTVTGNSEFYRSSENTGAIQGNAIFYGDTSENFGTVAGEKTRYYAVPYNAPGIVTDRSFLNNAPWKVVLDGITLIAAQGKYDESTIFQETNGGLLYRGRTGGLTNTIPIVTGGSAMVLNGKIYAPGNSGLMVFDDRTEAYLKTITSQTNGSYMTRLGNKIYTSGGSNINAFDTITDTLVATIPVGNSSVSLTPNGVKIYVTDQNQNKVYVIDTRTDTVTAQIPVGERPYYASTLGTKVYISNNGHDPDLAWSVSVIDTATDTVEATIPTGHESVLQTFVGTKLYVANKLGNTMTVIDTLTNTVLSNIDVGINPEMSVLANGKIYLNHRGGDVVLVIDPVSDTVIKSIPVGMGPYYLTASGKYVYIGNEGSTTVSVIDTDTDTVIRTIQSGYRPFYLSSSSTKIYVPNPGESLTTIDISQINLPELLSFSSSSASAVYSAGQSLNISANFNRPLQPGSAMTVRLNTGASVVLNAVNGSTLSGTYSISNSQNTPDLSVSAILSASVTDTDNNHRSAYAMPFYEGSFTGENSLINRNIGDGKNITIGSYDTIPVGNNPYQVSSAVNVSGIQFLYIANQGSSSVSVLRVPDNTLIATIPVGSEPYGLAPVAMNNKVYMYVANTNSDTVSVIDTSANAVIATIPVGVKPYYVAAIGTKVYVTNGQSNTVSAIDAQTNLVTATIPVGAYPRGIKAFGTDLYVADYGDPYYYVGGNSVSVINSLTNQVTSTIIMPAGSLGARGVTASADRVYVSNYRAHNISVINPATKAVIATIPVGNGPRGLAVLGSKLYVENFDDGTISVINTANNTVTATIDAGHSPAGMGIVGTDIYFSRFQDNELSILDTTTDTLRAAPPVPEVPTPSGGGSSGLLPASPPQTPIIPAPETPASTLSPCDQNGILNEIACEAETIFGHAKGAIVQFINIGTNLTRLLGSGERAGVIKSFAAAFGRPPASERDWSDIIKLSTGRWPSQRNAAAEARAAATFKTAYGRSPVMANAHDNAAIMMAAYGLRPVPRTVKNEIAALNTYLFIFHRLPLTTAAWDLVRAIGYSGATR